MLLKRSENFDLEVKETKTNKTKQYGKELKKNIHIYASQCRVIVLGCTVHQALLLNIYKVKYLDPMFDSTANKTHQ